MQRIGVQLLLSATDLVNFFDTLSLKQVDDLTVQSTQKKGGKVVGTTTRTISKDGKVLTLKSKGTGATGVAYDNVMVCDKK